MKNKLKMKMLISVMVLVSIITTSCVRYNINLNLDRFLDTFKTQAKNEEVVKESVEEEVVVEDTGENLVTLDGYVSTLSKYQLPKIGDIIGGFRVNDIFDFAERNAKVVSFEHEKTGAIAFLISNDDPDKMACIGFNTLAYDDSGLPHVFEHATLCGSDKYPSTNLFTEMMSKTYNTFINAYTLLQGTIYPLSSLSDEQLFAMYKVYIDGVFHPSVLHDEKCFEREAFRYSLYDKDADIDITGVVYNEMAGREANINLAGSIYSARTLFPNSYVGAETGGKTEDIPKITEQDLIEFHDRYYHPSNMVLTLYGNIDYEKYLKYADEEYLKNFDKIDIDKSDKNYVANSGFVEKSYDFAVASDSEVKNQSIITYSIPCEGISAYEAGVMQLVLDDLYSDDGYIRNSINEKIDKADFAVENNLNCAKPYVNITYYNVDVEDKDMLKEITEEALANTVEYGMAEETMMAFKDVREMSVELSKDSHGFTGIVDDFYEKTFRDNGKDLKSYFKFNKGMDDIDKRLHDGTVDKLIKRYFGDLSHSAMTIITPKPGLLEENNEKLRTKLLKMKDDMSDDEISALIKKNEEYDVWVEKNSKINLIDKVRVASVSGLEEYRAKCYAYEENVEGIRFIRSDIPDVKFNEYRILFDASFVPYEDTLKLQLLSELFLTLPTTNYENYTLSNEFALYAYTYGVSLYNNKYYNGGYKPYLMFSVSSLDKYIDDVFVLLKEMMYETKFDNVEKLRNYCLQSYSSFKSSFDSDASYFAGAYISAKTDEAELYNLHVGDKDYADYLKYLSTLDDDGLKEVLKDCERLLHEIYNKNGMVCEIVSNINVVGNIKSNVLELSRGMKDKKITSVDYTEDLKKYEGNIALAGNAHIQYNYIGIPFKDKNEFTAKYYVINNWLNDTILYPEFRVKRGCYGAFAESSIKSCYMYTYRDGSIKETYDVFKELPRLMEENKLTKDDLEDYKLSAYSYFSYPLTKREEAYIAINEILTNCDDKRPERYIRYMREIKDTTLEDIEELKKTYVKIVEEGFKVTAGGKEKVLENKDLFDEIVDYSE